MGKKYATKSYKGILERLASQIKNLFAMNKAPLPLSDLMLSGQFRIDFVTSRGSRRNKFAYICIFVYVSFFLNECPM